MKSVEFKDLPIGSLFAWHKFSCTNVVFEKISHNFALPLNYESSLGLDQRSQMFGRHEIVHEIDEVYINELQDHMENIRREFSVLSHVKNLFLNKNLARN